MIINGGLIVIVRLAAGYEMLHTGPGEDVCGSWRN